MERKEEGEHDTKHEPLSRELDGKSMLTGTARQLLYYSGSRP